MAFVETPYAALDTKLTFVVRGRAIAGHVVQLPFYKRSK
jgi:glycine cleavage system aminomethyltransferase T